MKNSPNIQFLEASKEDLESLEIIRQNAFKPVFDSFKSILGETIYEQAQKPEDLAQKDMLSSLFDEDSIWDTWKVIFDDEIAGFLSVGIDQKQKVGEIGLNAVDPKFGGNGIGTKMYEFALDIMRKEGMKVATVATGGDPSHLPARKAYRNAGFDVEIPSVWMCKEL